MVLCCAVLCCTTKQCKKEGRQQPPFFAHDEPIAPFIAMVMGLQVRTLSAYAPSLLKVFYRYDFSAARIIFGP